nr:PREDICTED: ralBP1-associated Eps domain-containing protein 2 [Bos indicus]
MYQGTITRPKNLNFIIQQKPLHPLCPPIIELPSPPPPECCPMKPQARVCFQGTHPKTTGAGERQDLVLARCVMLEQLDQGFHSTDGSRSFRASFGSSEKFIPSPHRELEGWPGPKDTSANLLPSSSGGQPGVWSLGLSRAAVTDRQQGAEDLLWLLEKQQQQQAPLESSPASTSDADAPLPGDPHRRVKQQGIALGNNLAAPAIAFKMCELFDQAKSPTSKSSTAIIAHARGEKQSRNIEFGKHLTFLLCWKLTIHKGADWVTTRIPTDEVINDLFKQWLLTGSVAKNFFTKSKLSIPELSYIWELSDADCDGALTLPEFCAAFHLIVARKNGYPLPEGLPPTLQPEYLQAAFPKPKWECALFDSYSESIPANQQPRDLNRMEKLSIKDMADFPVPTQDVTGDDKQALKSATDEALPKDMSEDSATPKDSNSLKARPRSRSYSSTSIEEAMKRGEDPPTPPPRPQKTHSRASSLDLNKVFQPSVPASKSGLLPPPPALPPRPCPSQISHHIVNSEPSTQLKPPAQLPKYGDFRLQKQSEQASEAEVHPQLNRAPSQAAESSPTKKEIPYSQPPSKPIRRKFRPENQATENQEPSTTVGGPASVATVKPHPAVQKQSSKQKKAIQTAIRKNKEANAVLARLNSELQQQLKEVHQERIALENQLEQLRPVTVL